MKISVSYIFLILLIVAFSIYAQYNIKKYSIDNKWFYMCLAIVSSVVVCFLLYKIYKQPSSEMGTINLIWSVCSIISIVILGRVAFHEIITKYDIIGIVFCLIGLYFIILY